MRRRQDPLFPLPTPRSCVHCRKAGNIFELIESRATITRTGRMVLGYIYRCVGCGMHMDAGSNVVQVLGTSVILATELA